MKIAVVAANGKAGQLIVKEALERGHQVTAIVRSENKTAATSVLQKDIHELTKEDLAGFDVVVSAFGAWTPETFPQHTSTLQVLTKALAGSSTRLFVVGGAGSLYLDEGRSLRLMEAPDFPAAYLPIAEAMAKGLDFLRTVTDLNWVYVSPAADFQDAGEKTGHYILAGEVFTLNSKGESIISYADFALALVDEIEANRFNQERISVLQA